MPSGRDESKLRALRLRRAARRAVVSVALVGFQRAAGVGRQLVQNAWWSLRWLVFEREREPIAYALTARNRRHLGAFVATVGDCSIDSVEQYLAEIDTDKALRDHLRAGPREAARLASSRVLYGSRVAAYVLTRVRRPRTVVESGVGAGVVACMVAAALERNAAEGHPGFYFGLDPHFGSGRLLAGRYERYGWILAGAPQESLKELEEIDLFLHSRRCSREHEAREYETLAGRLSEGALVLSSTAHTSDALHDFALCNGRRFLHFAEEPHQHWYRGGGLGAGFP